MNIFGIKKHTSLVLASAVLITGFGYEATAFDTTPPKIESCEINVKSVPSMGGEVTVTAQIRSVNELDRTPVIRMFNSGYERFIADVKSAQLTSGDGKFGTWTSTFSVLTERKPDRYYVFFDPLWDKGGNSDKTSFKCENAYLDYGGYQWIASTPTPKASIPPSLQLGRASEVTRLRSQLTVLQKQIKSFEEKLKKICASRPKPKGC